MAAKRLITVFGATGNQGGSVISAVLSSSALSAKYSLRGITRDPSKPAGQALTAKGVEMVQADLGDVNAVRKAVAGSYAVFGVTNYWEKQDGKLEEAQGKAIADAAFQEGVKHIVWSGLPYTEKLTDGKLPHIYHFDAKARVQEYIEQHKKATGTLATHVHAAYFMSNVRGSIQKGPDGKFAWSLPISPDAHIPLIDINADFGGYVLGALEAGQAADGVTVQAASEWSTAAKMMREVSDVTGTEVGYNEVSPETFKSFLPEPVADEFTENMLLIADYQYYGKGSEKNQAQSDKFIVEGAKLTSWKEYVQKTQPWELK